MHTNRSWVGRLRWRRAALTLLVTAFVLWASVKLIEQPTQVNLAIRVKGALVLSVFGGDTPEPLDSTGFPSAIRRRLDAYSVRRSTFRSRLPVPLPVTPEHDAWSRRVWVERAIVALVDAPGIEDRAAAYAAAAPLGESWKDSSEGPLAEARDAEAYLDANPSTPLKPYLWLFLMHRLKAAQPLLRSEGADESEIGNVTMKYARYRALVAGSHDPLISLTGADIDVVVSVYPLVRKSR